MADAGFFEDEETALRAAQAAGVIVSPFVKLYARSVNQPKLCGVALRIPIDIDAVQKVQHSIRLRARLQQPIDMTDPRPAFARIFSGPVDGTSDGYSYFMSQRAALAASDEQLMRLPVPPVDAFLSHVLDTSGMGASHTTSQCGRLYMYAVTLLTLGTLLQGEVSSLLTLLTVPIAACYPPAFTAALAGGMNATAAAAAFPATLGECGPALLDSGCKDALTYLLPLSPGVGVLVALLLALLVGYIFNELLKAVRVSKRAGRLLAHHVYLGVSQRRLQWVALGVAALALAFLADKYIGILALNDAYAASKGLPSVSCSADGATGLPVRTVYVTLRDTKQVSGTAASFMGGGEVLLVLQATVVSIIALGAPLHSIVGKHRDLLGSVPLRALIRCGSADCPYHGLSSGKYLLPDTCVTRTMRRCKPLPPGPSSEVLASQSLMIAAVPAALAKSARTARSAMLLPVTASADSGPATAAVGAGKTGTLAAALPYTIAQADADADADADAGAAATLDVALDLDDAPVPQPQPQPQAAMPVGGHNGAIAVTNPLATAAAAPGRPQAPTANTASDHRHDYHDHHEGMLELAQAAVTVVHTDGGVPAPRLPVPVPAVAVAAVPHVTVQPDSASEGASDPWPAALLSSASLPDADADAADGIESSATAQAGASAGKIPVPVAATASDSSESVTIEAPAEEIAGPEPKRGRVDCASRGAAAAAPGGSELAPQTAAGTYGACQCMLASDGRGCRGASASGYRLDPSTFLRISNEELIAAGNDFFAALIACGRLTQMAELPRCCRRVCPARVQSAVGILGNERKCFTKAEQLNDYELSLLLAHIAWVGAYKAAGIRE